MANNEDKNMKDKLMDKLKKLFGNDLPDLDMDIQDTLDDSLDEMGLEDEVLLQFYDIALNKL